MDDARSRAPKEVAVVTARRASAESLVAACAARGIPATVVDPREIRLCHAPVVVLDFTSGAEAVSEYAKAADLRDVRVIVLGSATAAIPEGVAVSSRVDADVTVDEFVSLVCGSRVTAVGPIVGAPEPRSGHSLTPREQEVLAALVTGGNTESVAKKLGISAFTVRTHVQNVLSKLGVSSRAEAAAWALREGIDTMASADGSSR